MKNIKISKILLFVLVGGIIPFVLVYLTASNKITFPGSRLILGLALTLLIIICALIVGNKYSTLNNSEKIINTIISIIIYTIIFVCFFFFIFKPVDYKITDLLITGYYGVLATVFAICTRDNSKEDKK